VRVPGTVTKRPTEEFARFSTLLMRGGREGRGQGGRDECVKKGLVWLVYKDKRRRGESI